ncbi:putative membrane protein [Neolecta irregularis DAH-3]|uniref:Putative membrane protein n=1 Tax=Neolecta irregularis (strain DAH-3) TaxID=1198029 RepID=A0A1U7LIL5_NEOID|nr:putative membrane protein [Neolecta irregularis DAH-3]|eukprot:OLL22392.1 putative membrane protein [Neolecta irregularis DAH-3]
MATARKKEELDEFGLPRIENLRVASPLAPKDRHFLRQADVHIDASVAEGASVGLDEWQEMERVINCDLEMNMNTNSNTNNTDVKDAAAYTRVNIDEDAASTTSMDERTKYLFQDDDEGGMTTFEQMQATKQLLTDHQRIAYVGLCRLSLNDMLRRISQFRVMEARIAVECMIIWTQTAMKQQIMIEQLSDHDVRDCDLAFHLCPPKSPKSSDPNLEFHDIISPAQLSEQSQFALDVRWTVLCDLFLLLVNDGAYDSRARVLLERIGLVLGLSWLDISKFEKRVSDALEVQQANESEWKQQEAVEAREKLAKNKRYMMMGLATLGGGLVIGLSAGVLAPVIGAGFGAAFTTIGVAGTSAFLTGTSGAALITTGGAVTGATIAGKGMYRRTRNVKIFEFKPLHNNKRTGLLLTISGWMLNKEDDIRLPFSTLDPIMSDVISLYWDPEVLTSMGQTMSLLATEVFTQSVQTVLGQTILMSLMGALQWPLWLTKLGYLIDNPMASSLDRAAACGLILADTLLHRNLGIRPISLVGFSIGARVIYHCLLELARMNAYGLVLDVFLFGLPVIVKQDEWIQANSVVAGRFVNGYKKDDWVLGYLFRASSGGLGHVAGLKEVSYVESVENLDVTDIVVSHLAYRENMPRLMKEIGWLVTSEEIEEIEEADPNIIRERKIERQIREAEISLSMRHKNRRPFSFFGPKRRKKKDYFDYDEFDQQPTLFDVDMIRQEIENNKPSPAPVIQKPKESCIPVQPIYSSEGSEDQYFPIREIESSLPPLIISPCNQTSDLSNICCEPTHTHSFDLQHKNQSQPLIFEDEEEQITMSFE